MLNCINTNAQNSYIDSLKIWIAQNSNPENDSLRIVNYYLLSTRLAEIDPISAWKYAYEVDKLALKAKVKTGHAMSKINFAILERNDGNFEKSLEYYLAAMKMAETVGWEKGTAICLNNLGDGYKAIKIYDKSIEYANKAIEINKKLDQKKGEATNYELIGDSYFLSGKASLALYFFKKGYDIVKNDTESYQLNGKLLTGIAKVNSALKRYKLANEYFEAAAALNNSHSEKLQSIESYIEHSKSYRNQGELQKSINLLKKGLVLAEELNYNTAKSDLYYELSISNQMSGYYVKALENFQTHKALDDLIAKKKTTTRNETMNLRVMSFFKEKENIKLKQIKEDQETEIKSKASWIGLLAAALVLGILGFLFWFYKNRIESLNKIQEAQAATIRQMKISEQIRKQLARDLHDDMGSTLSSISILSQVAEKEVNPKDESAKNLLIKINANSQRMLDTMNDIVWTTQPVNDTLDSISVKIREFAAEMFDAKDINYSINIDESLLSKKLPANQVYNFYLIIKEAINNIAKYANAQNVSVAITKNEKLLHLLIADDGIGFDYQLIKDSGNGLKNMDRRSQDLGGEIKIISGTNNGTTLKLSFPLDEQPAEIQPTT
jgi:signal transduction histidine kinase